MERVDLFTKGTQFNNLVDDFSDKRSIYLHGIIPEVLSYYSLSFFEKTQKTTVLLAENDRKAQVLTERLAWSKTPVFYLGPSDYTFYNIENLEKTTDREWMSLLKNLEEKPIFVITTLEALSAKLTPFDYFKELTFTISEEDFIDTEEIIKKLSKADFTRVSMVESPGEFSIRGGIIDIFSPSEEYPLRLELFDDEIDSMRVFEVGTQRSIENISNYSVYPKTKFLLSEEMTEEILAELEKDLDSILSEDFLSEKYEEIRQKLKENLVVDNLDLLKAYTTKISSVFDYLPENTVFILDDIARIYDSFELYYDRFLEDYTHQLESLEVFENREGMIFSASELLKGLKSHKLLNVTNLKKTSSLLQQEAVYEIQTMEAPRFNNHLELFVDQVRTDLQRGYKILTFVSKEDRKLISDLLEEVGISSFILEEGEMPKSGFLYFVKEPLTVGFENRDSKTLFITKAELTGKERHQRRKKRKTPKRELLQAQDLTVGDYIVHENHGIGIYEGIEQKTVMNTTRDFVVLSYRGNDKLFIPTDQMDLVDKYLGKEAVPPRINKLSDASWHRTKRKVQEEVEKIAEDLVELYAKRQEEKGFAFSKDGLWQREFEESFPFKETEGQLRSSEAIKEDMESGKPMDRLLTADVGFGKTEVAMRAAFKAVMDDKQVAFLVPTTILAMQHYENFLERFKAYPMNIRMLSRFVTPKQTKEIFKEVEAGICDIVIGTHKILSDKLKFHDIGLLIIDEEQRFGVRHKEKLKSLKENIDVLALSATPIPRTLQMSLTGIRDLSVIEEPPENRHPTNTYIVEYQEDLMKDAILREVSRGGQVYFVYNRVETIEKMKKDLEELLPEITILVGHGQMPERQLEKTILDFSHGKGDVLLTTTIIETGMDLPNVNTLIVYHADLMGLSQLYQLKGRIGRSYRSSYAYFTYPPDKVLTEISEKRLKAIKDFNDFGSGFQIAMRDLELRGAGNLLGELQSGHITAIGYDLYIKMLEEAVLKIKGEEVEEDFDTQIDLPLDTYIPEDYIKDPSEKILLYQKMAKIKDREDYSEIVDELYDRFGDIPNSVLNILKISHLNSLAKSLKISNIGERNGELTITFGEGIYLSKEEIALVNDFANGQLIFNVSKDFSFRIPYESSLDSFIELLEKLKSEKNTR